MKKRASALLMAVIMVLTMIPTVFAEDTTPRVYVSFSYNKVCWGNSGDEDYEEDEEPGTVELNDGNVESEYHSVSGVLKALKEGKFTAGEGYGFRTYIVDTTKPLTITIPQAYLPAYTETISEKVSIVGSASENTSGDDLCIAYSGGITIQVAYDTRQANANKLTFSGGLEIGEGASLTLKNNARSESSGATFEYIFGDTVTVSGTLAFSGNTTGLGGFGTSGSVTFSDDAALNVEDGGEVTVGSVAVTCGDSTDPLITVKEGGTLNFATDGVSSYGTITTNGTAIAVEGGEATISAGTITSQSGAAVVVNAGSLTIETTNTGLSAGPLVTSITTNNQDGQAVDLAGGVTVKRENIVAVTVSEENADAGDNYVDNYGNIVLAKGATAGTDTLNAAVILADGTIIQGSEDTAPTIAYEEDEETVTKVTVPAGGSVTTFDENGDAKTTTYAVGAAVTSSNAETKVEENTISATGITLNQSSVTLYSNTTPNTATLTATLTPEDSTDTVTWTSDNASVATVDANGTVTAVSNGTATITATAGEKTATCTVTVTTYTSGGGSSSSSSTPTYSVSVDTAKNGTVTVSPKNASKGTTVTITAKPDKGYEVDEVVVTDKNGKEIAVKDKGNNKYTFTMPSGKVDVEVTFVKEYVAPAVSFDDVKSNAWYYDAAIYAAENGLMSGTGNGNFSPDMTTSRAMIWTTLARLDGQNVAVTSGNWYDKAQSWAVSCGVSDGTSPDAPITREQLAVMLYGFAKDQGYTTKNGVSLSRYTDASAVSPWAAEALEWAVGNGLISSMGNNILAPTGTATRAQVAVILMNFCENIAK